ncbi:unnamed protein product [Echinostoma caproni]|uniref:SAM-dependent methyltransferase n=1 Tax=Echinostoma caproni TaxID=27848 RepID=A0A183B556_9TREM|nr:unnamed protein product [Echinostoma caproni]
MTNSPVTALAWGMCKELHTMHHMLLAVGGLDQRIRTYLIHAGGRTTLFEQLEGPGGPVVDLQIRVSYFPV